MTTFIGCDPAVEGSDKTVLQIVDKEGKLIMPLKPEDRQELISALLDNISDWDLDQMHEYIRSSVEEDLKDMTDEQLTEEYFNKMGGA